MELSRRTKNVVGSLTLEIDAKAKQLKAGGNDVVGFGAGEPDFDTPDFIKDAAKEALDKGLTKYTPASGSLDLRQAICEKFSKDNNLSFKPGQIVVSNGAKHSLYNIFQVLLNPGDEVIIPAPYWVSYPEMVKLADGVCVFVDTKEEHGFKITEESLRNACTDNTKAYMLNSPSNPCGCMYDADELRAIAKTAMEKDFFIVSDEIYEDIVYDGKKAVSILSLCPEAADRIIIVNGLSKAYSMTGWRIGYTASSEKIAKLMGDLQSHATSNPNSIAQYAGAVALRGPKDELHHMVSEFDKRRRYMYERINSIEGLSCLLPEGAFYIMLNISRLIGKRYNGKAVTGSMDFSAMLLESKNVAVVPGVAFGADDFLRLSYATSMANIQKGLDRIEEFAASLN